MHPAISATIRRRKPAAAGGAAAGGVSVMPAAASSQPSRLPSTQHAAAVRPLPRSSQPARQVGLRWRVCVWCVNEEASPVGGAPSRALSVVAAPLLRTPKTAIHSRHNTTGGRAQGAAIQWLVLNVAWRRPASGLWRRQRAGALWAARCFSLLGLLTDVDDDRRRRPGFAEAEARSVGVSVVYCVA